MGGGVTYLLLVHGLRVVGVGGRGGVGLLLGHSGGQALQVAVGLLAPEVTVGGL